MLTLRILREVAEVLPYINQTQMQQKLQTTYDEVRHFLHYYSKS